MLNFGKFLLNALIIALGIGMASFQAQAAESITPATIDIPLERGQSFSLDILYESGDGGDYDVSIKQFSFDAQGEKVFRDDPGFMTLSALVLEMEPKNKEVIVLSGIAPDNLPDGDYYYSVHVTRRKDDPTLLYTTNLATQVFVKVGENDRHAVNVSEVKVVKKDGAVDTVNFTALNTTDRYFAIFPTIIVVNAEGGELQHLKGDDLRVFPGVPRHGSFVWFAGENFVVPDNAERIEFQLLNERDEILYTEELKDIANGDPILAKIRTKLVEHSGLKLRVRHDFLWTDWFLRFVMIVMGLSLLSYYFYYRR